MLVACSCISERAAVACGGFRVDFCGLYRPSTHPLPGVVPGLPSDRGAKWNASPVQFNPGSAGGAPEHGLRRRLLREGTIVVAAKAASAVVMLAVAGLVARILPIEAVGSYFLAYSIVAILGVAFSFGLGDLGLRLVARATLRGRRRSCRARGSPGAGGRAGRAAGGSSGRARRRSDPGWARAAAERPRACWRPVSS